MHVVTEVTIVICIAMVCLQLSERWEENEYSLSNRPINIRLH